MNLLQRAYDPEQFRQQGHQLIDQLADYLQSAQSRALPQAITYAEPEEQYEFWTDWEAGQSTEALFNALLQNSVKVHHPCYMGHQISPPLPVTALAGLASDFLNNGMGVYEMGAGATAMEKVVIQTVAKAMQLGSKADGFLTSGGTLANLTALLTARRMQAKTDVWAEGTKQQYAIMVSEEAHYCVDRAVRIMGWGDRGVIKIPTDSHFKIKKKTLTEEYLKAKKEGIEVIAIVGSACTTSTGSFDDLNAIADFCSEYDVWMHVDGAHGGGTVFSDKNRHLVAGIERADSVIMDFHKLLMTPAVTTAVVYKDGRHAYNTFAQKAQYLWKDAAEPQWFNIAKRSFECTKTMMSLKVFSILNSYGTAIFQEYVDAVYANGKRFAALVEASEELELAVEPECNIVCFRYVDRQVTSLLETRHEQDVSDTHELKTSRERERLNEINLQIRQQLLEDGRFYVVQTNLRGTVYLRVTLSNAFTTESDMNDLLKEVVKIGINFI
ncbi:MAG: aspartate aminotransferase family protein [Saprospiraceae bacterium]